MTRKTEYREGKEARENFDAAMRILFQAPKTVSVSQKKKSKPKTSAGRVSSASDKEMAAHALINKDKYL